MRACALPNLLQKEEAEKLHRLNEPLEKKQIIPSVQHNVLMKKSWKAFQIMHDDMNVQGDEFRVLIDGIKLSEQQTYIKIAKIANKVTQSITQKASATVSGGLGFLTVIILIIALMIKI